MQITLIMQNSQQELQSQHNIQNVTTTKTNTLSYGMAFCFKTEGDTKVDLWRMKLWQSLTLSG